MIAATEPLALEAARRAIRAAAEAAIAQLEAAYAALPPAPDRAEVKAARRELMEEARREALTYTVPEAARELKIGVKRTYGLIRDGELEAMGVGHRLLVTRAHLDRFQARQGGVLGGDRPLRAVG